MMKKTISRFKLLPVLVASLFTQGCVGVVTRQMETQKIEPATVGEKPGIYSVRDSNREFASNPSIENPPSLWVEEHWGQPSQIKKVRGSPDAEVWTYRFEHKWCGVMPWVVIPIPLLLPVGRERVVFHIRDGRVARVEVTTVGGYEAMAGFGAEGPMASSGHWK